MKPWRELNFTGRLLLLCCLMNVWCAVVFAMEGSWYSIFSGAMAAYCGMSTYHSKYQKNETNDERRE